MISWQAMTDRFIFHKPEDEVISEVIDKTVSLAKRKSLVISEKQINGIKEAYRLSLKKTEALTTDLASLRNDPESFRQTYFPSCVRQVVEVMEAKE